MKETKKRRMRKRKGTPRQTWWRQIFTGWSSRWALRSERPLICEPVSPCCSLGCNVFILPSRCPFINLWLSLTLYLKRLVLNWIITSATEKLERLFLRRISKHVRGVTRECRLCKGWFQVHKYNTKLGKSWKLCFAYY